MQVSVDRVAQANGATAYLLPNTWLRWANLAGQATVNIPAGAPRYVEIGSFVDGTAAAEPDVPVLNLATGASGGLPVKKSPCIVDLTVTATNCDARRWRITITFLPSEVDSKKPQDVTLEVHAT
ncbi:MAG TPA: hypothetical protein VFG00_12775 [Acidothermaceae bacterium]|nr:hypothetical protein [Acidothermaceae bacterium]